MLLWTHYEMELQQTHILWKHETIAITFTLIVDDFGIGCSKQEDLDHLLWILKVILSLASISKGLQCTYRRHFDAAIFRCQVTLKEN